MRTVALLALLSCIGCSKKQPPSLPDRPLGTAVHFHTMHFADGKDNPHQFKLSGILGGNGKLTLDNNKIWLDSDGKIIRSTALGYIPGDVQIKRSASVASRLGFGIAPEREFGHCGITTEGMPCERNISCV